MGMPELRRGLCGALALAGIAVPAGAGEDCAARRPARIEHALAGGYGVQYWGEGYTAADLARQPHGLLILEMTRWGAGSEDRFSPQEVSRIGLDGARPVLAYLNVSEIEPFRDYYAAAEDRRPPWWGVERRGDHLAAYWTPEWRTVLEGRIDALMDRGVDGIFLDDALHYYTHMQIDDRDGGYPVRMMELVVALADRARRADCDALVVVNNAVYVGRDAGPDGAAAFDRYRDAIDGILIENAMAGDGAAGTLRALTEDYAERGIAVLTLDVVGPEGRDDVVERARDLGFAPYTVEDDSFSRLYPPAPSR